MLTANEILQNEVIAKAVDFSAYNNGVVRRILALLNRVDADLFAQISAALEQLPAESFTVERLESLLYSVRATNKSAYDAVGQELTKELRNLVEYESGYQQQLFASVLPVQINVASVVVEQVYSAAMARPFQGVLLSDALAGLEAGRAAKIRDALRMGYVEGQTISQMVTRLRGTRGRGYEDGLLEISRRDAAAVVRTATSHVAGFTRDRFYESNASLIKAVVWCSTIDARTTKSFCIPRDGKQYHPVTHAPIGHSMPWGAGPGRLHWNSVVSGTLVTTRRGQVAIELISVGDEVLTHKGRFKRVTALRSKKCDSGVVRVVHTESGRVLRASDDHPVLTAFCGWKFVGALELGDKLFCDPKSLCEVGNIGSKIDSKSKDRPPTTDDPLVALQRTIKLVSANIDFKGDFDVCASEIENRATDAVLSNPEWIERDECAQHHFFSIGQMLLKCGRDRFSKVLSGIHRHRDSAHSVAVTFERSSADIGRFDPCGNPIHPRRVVGDHSLGVASMDVGGFFCHSERPVVAPARPDNATVFDVDNRLLGLISDGNAMLLCEAGKASVSQFHVPFDFSERVSFSDMELGNNSLVIDFGFCHDAIVALEVQECNDNVYDLAVEGDCSYIASGIAVSNCRSSSTVALKSWRELGIPMDDLPPSTRASLDGQIAEDTTYLQWLNNQSAARQDDILGPTRGRLLRSGGAKAESFYDNKGRFLTLADLRERDAAMFSKAGL